MPVLVGDTTSQAYNTGKDNVQRKYGTPFSGATRGVSSL